LNFGGIGGFLVIKLVKPTIVFCSWSPYEGAFGKVLPIETKPHIRAAATRVLRKTDAAVGKKICGLDSADGVFYEAAELQSLFVGDGGSQVLNVHQSLANEHNLSNFGNARHP
jgi:hypothetical protein